MMNSEAINFTSLHMNEPKMALNFLVEKLGFIVQEDTASKNRDCVIIYDSHGNFYEIFLTNRNAANGKGNINIIINTTDCLQDFYNISPRGLSILSRPHYRPEGLTFEISDYWDNKYTFLEKRDYDDL